MRMRCLHISREWIRGELSCEKSTMDSCGIGRCSISFKWGKVGWKSEFQVRPDRSSSVAGVGQRRRVFTMSSSLSSSLVPSSLSSCSSMSMPSLPLPSSNCQWSRALIKNEGTFTTEKKNFVGIPTLRRQNRKLPLHSREARRISCHSFISAGFGSAIADGLTLAVQEPILRDTLAFVFSAIGAKGLVNAFEFLESSGYVDKVRLFVELGEMNKSLFTDNFVWVPLTALIEWLN